MTHAVRLLALVLAVSLPAFAEAGAGTARPASRAADLEPRDSIQIFGSGARWVTRAITRSAHLAKDAAVLEARIERRSTILLTRAWVDTVRAAAKLLAGSSCPVIPESPPGQTRPRASRTD